MVLRFIERGTRLQIVEKDGLADEKKAYDAIYHDMHDLINETSFVVKCPEMNKNYESIAMNTPFVISFTIGSNVYTFKGRVIGKMYSDSVIIEQTSNIETLNRRKYQRDEIRTEVRIYSLTEEQLQGPRFARPGTQPLMVEVSFDISAGGMCIITNSLLNPSYDPYYLIEFSLSDKDWFLIPAQLVRRSSHARSRIGKHDYGFQFIFKENSDERIHLTKAILNKKLSSIR